MNASASLPAVYWNTGQLIAFRFFTLLFTLFILFNPNMVAFVYPFWMLVKIPVGWLTNLAAQWIFHIGLPLNDKISGSGDRLIDFMHLFVAFALSVLGTVVWSVVDYRRRSYNQALYWVTVLVRYYLAITMFEYGMVKLLKWQFPDLTASKLSQRYGDSSPMGLAWRFLSYSTGYNYIMGFAEISGGLLLLYRRTVTLGAMLTFFVALNIMAINYCFDVAVKILSTALVMMSFFLLVLDARPLIRFFILGQPAGAPVKLKPEFKQRWINVTSLVLKCLVLLLVAGMTTSTIIKYEYAKYKSTEVKPGYYKVVNYREPGRPQTQTNMDPARWQKVMLTHDSLSVYIAGGVRIACACNIDAAGNQLICFKPNANETDFTLKYKTLKTGNLSLKGVFMRHQMVAKLAFQSAYHSDTTLLLNRGFHWINEAPFYK
ncbi:hypothetical protein [Mucilaginibacter sp. CSA2-8R]|uniref:hypothetical protein n=1 Tax=Mucilaginibacter sp. CSA2-8R TaxID=3141542 RepID=UPI00315CC48C